VARGDPQDYLAAFADVSAAVEAGAGLPEVARATNRALRASVAVVDSSRGVLAVACASPEDERMVLSSRDNARVQELRVADAVVGQLRYRPRGDPPPPALVRMVGALIALELERSRGPERAAREEVGALITGLLDPRAADRAASVTRARELGCPVDAGASVLIVHARPHHPEEGDWRSRVLAIIERAMRPVTGGSLAAAHEAPSPDASRPAERRSGADTRYGVELVVIVPGGEAATARRAEAAVLRELELGLSGYSVVLGRSRPAPDASQLHRAAAEAVLAANVAESQGAIALGFEETGAYRLLLPAMSEDPAELQRFHDETIAPLLAYDDQYQTELVYTLESYLEADGNVARTAQKLFTHRHTVRYRLERVRELTGLDVGSSDGRERLGLGLKAMRVLGILPPRGPSTEPGAEGGRVPGWSRSEPPPETR
jgi:sugar diacid utilization regulator